MKDQITHLPDNANRSVAKQKFKITNWPTYNKALINRGSGATVDEGFIVGGPVGDFELLLCHGTVCVVGKIRDLILQLSKSSIYSTKP
ncbi:hypothetical protein VZ141_29310, partial [Klebsiella pneumoniae]|nr:hypothetical protein [Klebsiella pneumoniae]